MIIYADRAVIICNKPEGVICEATEGKESVVSLLEEELSKGSENKKYVGLVHRLDQVTRGLMIFSADQKLTGKLSEAVAARDTEKEYLAIVHGIPDSPEGEMRDLLFRDAKKNKSYVVKRARKGVREALLSYRLLDSAESKYGKVSLVAIKLSTGRTHQIRVQFASRGMPLVGDGKYGAADNAPSVALLSHRLTFTHPTTKKRMSFEIDPPCEHPWDIFEYKKENG
jgi:23S rRNA pseudouridine1911/1915/1917 synthase